MRYTNKKLKVLFASLLLNAGLGLAETRETISMKEATSAADGETLLIFDIDNTIVKPSQTLGSDQWYDYAVKQEIAGGASENDAINRAIDTWTAVQKMTAVLPVEGETPELIRQKQKEGVLTMALTARPLGLIPATVKQLLSVGVDFKRTPVHGKSVSFKVDEAAQFSDGVLFVGPKNNKGKVLVEFLKKIKLAPKKIVFVDDKVKHIRNMEEALKNSASKYVGFRYGAADQEVASFAPEIANIQLKFFGGILDDGSARKLVEAKN